MANRAKGTIRGLWRSLLIVAVAGTAMIWSSAAMATITQGDFSVFGFFQSRESGRWGESSTKDNGVPSKSLTIAPPGSIPSQVVISPGVAASNGGGGSFAFTRWDLVQARQIGDIRPDYHFVKNYKFFGRFDTLILKDADFFAFYRPWYDAFGSIKGMGVVPPNLGWYPYSQNTLQQEYFQNNLHEYYAQLNFTDNFSMRVGKQEVIWTEADALSGTEITNSVDFMYHWDNFETPEYLRENLNMIKFNYILPDFLKTANNEAEFFWIPGDWYGDGVIVNTTDPRSPWIFPGALGPGPSYNMFGQPVGSGTFASEPWHPLALVGTVNGSAPVSLFNPGVFFQQNVLEVTPYPSNSIQNSEFGFRYSSLLPIGNGLQASFIFLYEDRLSTPGLCTTCGPQYGNIPAFTNPEGVILPHQKFTRVYPGVYFGPGIFDFGKPKVGSVVGTERILLSQDYRRNPFFGSTGTYYDKDLTDIVYRYDFLYAPRVGVSLANPKTRGPQLGFGSWNWTQETRFIVAGDRPTYIPWLSKQHTFLTFQYVNTWYPSLYNDAVPYFGDFVGKIRPDNNFFFLAATNWLMNGQLTMGNVFSWDVDDQVGDYTITNTYRYSRNVLFGLNATWYLGQSGRYTDPFSFSRDQTMNEIEASFTYEI